jgi:hypothetical protein
MRFSPEAPASEFQFADLLEVKVGFAPIQSNGCTTIGVHTSREPFAEKRR